MTYGAEAAENRSTNDIFKKKNPDSQTYYLNWLLQSFNMMHNIIIQLIVKVVLKFS